MGLDISAFYEDAAHEAIVGAFFAKHATSLGVVANLRIRNNQGGHGAMSAELRSFLSDVRRGEIQGDALLVGRDGNGMGVVAREREIAEMCDRLGVAIPMLFAIPDPYIERWLLLDAAALQTVFGVRYDTRTHQRDRNAYKNALAKVCADAGINSPTGGIEFAEDIVAQIDFVRVRQTELGIDRLLRGIEQLRSIPGALTG